MGKRQVIKFVVALGFIVLIFSCATTEKIIEISVSKNGSEAKPGELQFVTFKEAIDQAVNLRKKTSDAEVVITVAPGIYHLQEAIKIPASLSDLTIKGSDAEEVIITGGKELQLKWQKYDENIFVAEVNDDLKFDQFLVNQEPQVLARYPNYNEEARYWQGYAEDAVSKERLASWEHPKGAYFHALHSGRWGGFHYEISGVDDNGSPVLKGGQQNNRASKPHKEFRMVENVFEELDSAGEWFFDAKKKKLFYWPTSDIELSTATFEVSVLDDLVKVVGTLEEPVTNVRISGITFKNTQRTFMKDYEPLLRSDWMIYRGASLFFENTENCTVENSVFTNLGGNVIMASKYNKGLTVSGNHIYNCGASAISFIGDPSAVRSPSFNYSEFVAMAEMDTVPGPKNEFYPRECLVENNLIHRIGRLEKQTAGVQIAMAMNITVRHNSIYDVPRAGINIGDGTWGGHILEYNDVFNTVLETSDHGSFNSWGRDRFWLPNRKEMDSLTTARPDMWKWDAVHTTIIRNNRFRCDHGWDIDLDDGSSNYHIYNNLLLNNGLKLREGFHRVAKNNIMVNNSLHPHVWFVNSEDVFKHNIVGGAYQDVRLEGWGKELDYNLFPNEVTMLKSQIYNRDLHSAYGDPMFKKPENLDFSVLPESPALKIGFENFPMDKFGVQKPNLKEIAKTPEVPKLEKPQGVGNDSSPVVQWLRNGLKSVDSQEEQSAYGLKTAEGVIVLNVWNQSPAVKDNGLKQGDVILSANGKKVKEVKDFFKLTSEYSAEETLDLVIMRDQEEQKITIRTK
ncbi:pectinesterase family protein [Zobellia alginiliquefaciens]|uniref:pectinesterase family protein n=1 Tax=Zobellia alginiliquefaciens TaxID=3032586 RepID=UPI0023E467EF|nr:pectinesterase family protein [Zobellia alginiliquefaciens]